MKPDESIKLDPAAFEAACKTARDMTVHVAMVPPMAVDEKVTATITEGSIRVYLREAGLA
jgi:hypothetical protein